MIEIFKKGGPIMWPLFVLSILSLSVVIERAIFFWRAARLRNLKHVDQVLTHVQAGEDQKATAVGEASSDLIARTLAYGLKFREQSFNSALLRQAAKELKPYSRGLTVLDTTITLAPLLGLLGTVTGMIAAFGLLGQNELSAPTAITGGIAEALIATAYGLGIAIVSLIPFNYLNASAEDIRHEMEDACTHLEMLVSQSKNSHENSIR